MTVTITTDHEEIRRWVERHGGSPARFSGISAISTISVPAIRFGHDSELEDISWEEFFEAFELNRLALTYDANAKEVNAKRALSLVRREWVSSRSRRVTRPAHAEPVVAETF